MDGESLINPPSRTLVRRRFIAALAIVMLIYFLPMDYDFAVSFADKMRIFEIERTDPVPEIQCPILRKGIEKPSHPQKSQEPFSIIIHRAANLYEIDAPLIKAIIMVESSYNPRAISRRGAKGLMQLMPETAEALGVKDSFNPEYNITAGVKYFKQLRDRFNGNTELALAAYNAGSRKVRQYNGIPPFESTRKYVKKVLMYYRQYKEKEVTMS
jgi:hypothetical protein